MMASMKPTTKACKSSTPTRDAYSKSSSRAGKVVQSSDKQALSRTKSNVPSLSVNKVYTSKEHNVASKSQSQGSRSKQGLARGTKPATGTAIKQTTSSKPKQQVKRAASDEGKSAYKSEKHAQGADTNDQKTRNSKVDGDKTLGSSKLEDSNGSLDVGESKDGGSENNRRLLDVVRERCLAKGRHGIHGLGLLFRHLDVDYNKRIVFEELKDKLKDFGVELSDGNLRALFKMLDVDKSGGIDFLELMTSLRPPMKEARRKVIDEAFDIMDRNGNGVVDQEEIKDIDLRDWSRYPVK